MTILALAVPALWALAGEGEGARAAGVTLRVVGLATLCTVGLGIPAALLLARWQSRARGFVEAALLAPMLLPPTVVGFLLARIFGALGLTFTWTGAALASAVVSFPLFLRAARPAFASVDSRYLHLARSLGAGPGRVFLRVTLPLAAPGLLAGAALALGRAMGEFGATMMVAGSIPGETRTLSLAVYAAFAQGDEPMAIRLALVLIGVAVLLVGGAALFERAER